MKKYIAGAVLSLGVLISPTFTQAAGLTTGQANSLIAVVQAAPGVPASAFVNLITSFSNITVNQATSLIAVVQSAPTAPASAFVNLLISFTADTTTQVTTPATNQAVTPTEPQSTTQTTPSTATTQPTSNYTPKITSTSAKAADNFEMDAGSTASIFGTYLAGNTYSTTKVYFYDGTIQINSPITQAPVTLASDNLLQIVVPSSLTAGKTYNMYVSNEKGTSNIVKVKILTNVTAPVPTVSLSAFPTSVTSGQSTTITWSSTNTASCTFTSFGDWAAGGAPLSGSATVSVTTSKMITLTCLGTNGQSVSQSVGVNVITTPTCSNGQLCTSSASVQQGINGWYVILVGSGFLNSSAISLSGSGYTTTIFSPYPGSVNSNGSQMSFNLPANACNSANGFCQNNTYSVQVMNGNSVSNTIPVTNSAGG